MACESVRQSVKTLRHPALQVGHAGKQPDQVAAYGHALLGRLGGASGVPAVQQQAPQYVVMIAKERARIGIRRSELESDLLMGDGPLQQAAGLVTVALGQQP